LTKRLTILMHDLDVWGCLIFSACCKVNQLKNIYGSRLQQIFQRQESFPCQLSFLQNSVFSDSMSCLNLMNQKGVVEHDWLAIMRGVAKMQLTVVENNFFYVTMNINKP